MLKRLKAALSGNDSLNALLGLTVGQPTNPARVPLGGQTDPQGLRLLHATGTMAEADMLRQVLTEAGFHMEFVPAATTGVFGTSGSSSIFVHEEQYDEAHAFLQEYLAAEPLPEDDPT